jgi:hypothetical protein
MSISRTVFEKADIGFVVLAAITTYIMSGEVTLVSIMPKFLATVATLNVKVIYHIAGLLTQK